jgi:hypothetical protein
MECPLCRCKTFYVKDPDDEYEIEEFDCDGDNLVFHSDPPPDVQSQTEVYCNNCSWHDKFDALKKA